MIMRAFNKSSNPSGIWFCRFVLKNKKEPFTLFFMKLLFFIDFFDGCSFCDFLEQILLENL